MIYTVIGQREHEYELVYIIAEMVQFVNVACARATAALVQALSHKALVAIPAPRNPGGGWRRETAGDYGRLLEIRACLSSPATT